MGILFSSQRFFHILNGKRSAERTLMVAAHGLQWQLRTRVM